MENLFGVHDWGTGKELSREWLSDDPYFPCNAFDEKYQKGCWLNQAARIYQMENGDVAKLPNFVRKLAMRNTWHGAWIIWLDKYIPLPMGIQPLLFNFVSKKEQIGMTTV